MEIPADSKLQSKVTFALASPFGGSTMYAESRALAWRASDRDQCSERASVAGGLEERSTEWGSPLGIAQMDFAQACDGMQCVRKYVGILDSDVISAMEWRSVPRPLKDGSQKTCSRLCVPGGRSAGAESRSTGPS